MKPIVYVVWLLFVVPNVGAAEDTCDSGLTAFTCSDSAGVVVLNRCATGNECYNKDHEGKEIRCCPVFKNTDNSTAAFVDLVNQPSLEKLIAFKKSCNYSSQINFDGDPKIAEASKKFVTSANLFVIRGMFHAQSNCTDGHSTEVLQSWLGNEILINSPKDFIQAFSDENQNEKSYKLVEAASSEWFAIECQDPKCDVSRKEYFAKKRTALKTAKIPKSLEPIREGLLKALKSDL